jgi:hypothetical protein
MINRFLGIDNCIGCDQLLTIPDQLKCKRYKEIINKDCFSIPLKLEYCDKPFKYDSKALNSSNDKIVD